MYRGYEKVKDDESATLDTEIQKCTRGRENPPETLLTAHKAPQQTSPRTGNVTSFAIKISGESRGIFVVGAQPSFDAQTIMISMRRVRVRAGVIDALAAPGRRSLSGQSERHP